MRILFTFILASCACNTTLAQIKYGDNKNAGHYLAARGFKMYYETYGNGEPLLFIHGNGGSLGNFSNQIPFFQCTTK